MEASRLPNFMKAEESATAMFNGICSWLKKLKPIFHLGFLGSLSLLPVLSFRHELRALTTFKLPIMENWII